MRFKEFLLNESNVNSLIKKAYKTTVSHFESEIEKYLVSKTIDGMWTSSDGTEKYFDSVRKDFKPLVVRILETLEKEYQKIATDEVEARFGKITQYKDLDHTEVSRSWDKLWWVGHVLVFIEDDRSLKRGPSGYFQRDAATVRDVFPSRKTTGIDDRNEVVVGIQVAVNVDDLSKALCDEVTDYVADTSEMSFRFGSSRHDDLGVVRDVVDVFSHEVTHLLQYVRSSLKTNERLKYTIPSAFTKKNYMKKRDLDKIERIMTVDTSKWSDRQWERYLSSALEIDAHAVSVASKIINTAGRDGTHQTELWGLEYFLDELKGGYFESGSFEHYRTRIKEKIGENQRFAIVWKRFLKKIASQVLDRIGALKKEVAEIEKSYRDLENSYK